MLVQVISRQQPEWVSVFTGLTVRQFDKLVGVVAACGGQQTGTGRRWGLSLADRVLLVAVYYRTNLTYRQVALLFGVSKGAVASWRARSGRLGRCVVAVVEYQH